MLQPPSPLTPRVAAIFTLKATYKLKVIHLFMVVTMQVAGCVWGSSMDPG